MKNCCLLICIVVLMFSPAIVLGQNTAPGDLYVKQDMDAYSRDLWKTFSVQKYDTMVQTMKGLKESAALLTDDKPVARPVQMLNGKPKAWKDEEIYSKRKNSVLIIGRYFYTAQSTGNYDTEFSGTAFAISADGVCVTNYHILKDVIQAEGKNTRRDSACFVQTVDKKVYFIKEILAYSRNNDLAIFKVDTHGDQLSPIPLGKPAEVGTPVYCLSHPGGYFYSFSKGIVARNIAIDPQNVAIQSNQNGTKPIRMEITADYAVGSSGGPILDRAGNLIGIVISTSPIGTSARDTNGKETSYTQMMVKDTCPVKALADLLGKN
jgi:serine protease Do